jgi:hypothetical protein
MESIPCIEEEDGRLRKKDWEVRDVAIDVARELVKHFHYARGASNTATCLHGMFRRGESGCLGAAWWIPPTRSAAEATFPANWKGVLALSRLVIAPGVPKNACTFLLSRSVRLICVTAWPCLVTYADEWREHSGTIYRAAGWRYVGKTSPEATYTMNGVMVSRKAGPKTRRHSEMMALGAQFEGRHARHKFVLIRNESRCRNRPDGRDGQGSGPPPWGGGVKVKPEKGQDEAHNA